MHFTNQLLVRYSCSLYLVDGKDQFGRLSKIFLAQAYYFVNTPADAIAHYRRLVDFFTNNDSDLKLRVLCVNMHM